MTLQEFKQGYGKEYTKGSKKSERFYIFLGIFFAVMFVGIAIGGVVGTASDDTPKAFLAVPLCVGIGIAAFFIWCTKRNVRNVHSEFGNPENIKVYKAICTGKKVVKEDDGEGYSYDVYYIDFSLGEGYAEGTASVHSMLFNNIAVQGECVVVQLGNSMSARFQVLPMELYMLESYDEPNETNFLKRMATTDVSVAVENIPILKTGGYTAGTIICAYFALGFTIGGIVGTVEMINDSVVSVARAIFAILAFIVLAGGFILATYACSKAKKKKIQKWFRNLEETGISQVAQMDSRTAYNIYMKYPKTITYNYVYSLNPAIEQMVGK
ncbi:MAG: hypothetical protein MJ105_00410 [Lachnospiraceae bacterium]|nr:hypothetical protein [Lachnospiraceae bacterium]